MPGVRIRMHAGGGIRLFTFREEEVFEFGDLPDQHGINGEDDDKN